jgi:hypothetical protein
LAKTAKKKKKTAKKTTAKKKTSKKAASSKKKDEIEKLEIPKPDFKIATVRIVGDSPLVMHKFSEKARKEIAAKQQGKRTAAKGQRDPKAEFEAAMYVIKGKPGTAGATYGMPATAFKRAMIDACRWVKGIRMTEARGAFHVIGDLVPLTKASKPRMEEDVIRLPNGNADLRYRPYFDTWECTLKIQYHAGFIGLTELVNLLETAGSCCGIGDRRPQQTSGDNHGMFHVAQGKSGK